VLEGVTATEPDAVEKVPTPAIVTCVALGTFQVSVALCPELIEEGEALKEEEEASGQGAKPETQMPCESLPSVGTLKTLLATEKRFAPGLDKNPFTIGVRIILPLTTGPLKGIEIVPCACIAPPLSPVVGSRTAGDGA
jgi:hypothetical protein